MTLPSGNSFVIPYLPTSLMYNTEPIYVYVETGIDVPPGTAAHMRFTGKLTGTPTPACRHFGGGVPPAPEVPWPTVELYVGGVNRSDVGNVEGDRVVWFPGPVLGNGSEWPRGWAYFPGDANPDAPTSDSAVVVYQPDAPGMDGSDPAITFRRDPFYSICGAGELPWTWVETYTLSGSQQVDVDFVAVEVTTIAATGIPAAMTTTAATTAGLQSGEPITYQANSVNFAPDTNLVLWQYTLDANPQNPIFLEACYSQTTCTYAATGPGRMQAGIRLSRFFIWGSSAHVEQGPDRKLVVVCEPDPVVRGRDVTCTARLSTDDDWTFVSAISAEIGADPGDDDIRAFPDMHLTADGKGQSTTGKAVFSSTVVVQGQVGDLSGPVVSGTGSFKVKPRPDFPTPILPPVKIPQKFELVSPNFPPDTLGAYTGPVIDFNPNTGPPIVYQSVDAGPNTGYSYLTAPPAFKRPSVLLHMSLFGFGEWFLDQNGVDHGQDIGAYDLPYCTPDDILDRLKAEVIRHEAGPIRSHDKIWRDMFPQPNVRNFFDRFYFKSERGEKHAKNKLENKWSAFKKKPEQRDPHDLWEREDNGLNYELVQKHAGCAFDNNPGD